ncbi:hypothetical protein N4P33_05655 [Streptomyces sp. 15-116A]|uniref:hypothetical protein n=1 Tax=Streptomyces sp. 15-116A TaxID=2259035 RepID=UPI0021B2328E|nr:hypothetical protein [Streptomyces sp. 15-116A]MCT7351656.1 hypothetical protein [Streptomyces sp. 15-116A]
MSEQIVTEASATEEPVPVPPVPAPPVAVTVTPPPPAPPVKRDRRVLRAVLRWTAAVVVFAAVGASTAYGITRMERTDVPGLATEPDGRWDYPTLTRPPLPSGSPGPQSEANLAGTHHADLRELVLPAPERAEQDPALRGTDGWLKTDVFLKEYAHNDDREEFGDQLAVHALRHIAARGWTMPDGTRTRIYLLQFNTAAVVDALIQDGLTPTISPRYPLRGAEDSEWDEKFLSREHVEGVRTTAYVENGSYGDEQVRQAYLTSGDTLAVIVQSRKGGAEAVPFWQTVLLQGQLLA